MGSTGSPKMKLAKPRPRRFLSSFARMHERRWRGGGGDSPRPKFRRGRPPQSCELKKLNGNIFRFSNNFKIRWPNSKDKSEFERDGFDVSESALPPYSRLCGDAPACMHGEVCKTNTVWYFEQFWTKPSWQLPIQSTLVCKTTRYRKFCIDDGTSP